MIVEQAGGAGERVVRKLNCRYHDADFPMLCHLRSRCVRQLNKSTLSLDVVRAYPAAGGTAMHGILTALQSYVLR